MVHDPVHAARKRSGMTGKVRRKSQRLSDRWPAIRNDSSTGECCRQVEHIEGAGHRQPGQLGQQSKDVQRSSEMALVCCRCLPLKVTPSDGTLPPLVEPRKGHWHGRIRQAPVCCGGHCTPRCCSAGYCFIHKGSHELGQNCRCQVPLRHSLHS